jgi:hypothetical protein
LGNYSYYREYRNALDAILKKGTCETVNTVYSEEVEARKKTKIFVSKLKDIRTKLLQ